MPFKRGLSDTFVKLLWAEADKGGWWRDVLNDPTLLIGVREEYLNVYWQGQALFTVQSKAGTLQVTTHEKFLLDPDLKGQVGLADGKFDVAKLQTRGFIAEFQAGKTLSKMKRAAQRFAGPEKTGCHVIAEQNATVVDFEVAFPVDPGSVSGKLNKVDLACFEEGQEDVSLTFWEAKHFSNAELRARHGAAPVVDQIQRYEAWIKIHEQGLKNSYRNIAKNLVTFQEMGWKRDLNSSVLAVANGSKPLSLSDVPYVSLLVFGFDQDQKDGQTWAVHREKLKEIDRIVPVGNPADVRLPIRAKDSPTKSPVAEPPIELIGNAG